MDLFGLGSKRTSETGTWTEDSDANTCFICACSFGLITRRHHCRQCGQVVCDPCSQNRKLLESSRTGQLKRVCLKCWDGTQSAASRRLEAMERAQASAGGSGAGSGRDASPRAPVPVARLPDVPTEEAIAALAEVTFEGPWEFTFLFTQVDLGPTGGGATPAPSSTAAMLGSGGFASGKASMGSSKKLDKSVRENSKVTLGMELKTKGAAYFQGEITQEFAVFGAEGKVTGALQRGTGKVSTTMQMISRNGTQAVTTSFNLVGVVNKEGVYSGTFTACEISKNAGSCSGLFKGKKVAPMAPDSDEEAPAAGGGAAAAAAAPAAAAPAAAAAAAAAAPSKKKADSDDEEEEAEARKKAAAKEAKEAKKRAEAEAEAAAAKAAAEAEAAAAAAAAAAPEADEAAAAEAKAKRKEERRLAKQKAAEEAEAEAAAAAAAEAEAAAAAEAKAARKAAKAAAKAAAAAAGEE